MKQSGYTIALLACLSLLSCEKALFDKNQETSDPVTNFEYLWKECDEKYAFFELKNIDWEQVHTEYSAKINPNISDDSLFRVLGDMLIELKDDHTNLFSNLNISFYGLQNQKPDNFDWRIVEDHYLPKDYYISGPFIHDFIANEQVGYIRFSEFTGTVNSENMNFMLTRYKNTKGLILDLRENSGGSVSDVFAILSHFIDTEKLLYYSRIKNGPGHSDFSEDEPGYLSPTPEVRYLKKVMVLVDRGTYSAGSFTSLATKAIPNMVLVGDTTGGGLGLPNGGQLPNGWSYRFSITQTLDLNKNNTFENGVPPDISASFDWGDLSKDEIIERALLEIL